MASIAPEEWMQRLQRFLFPTASDAGAAEGQLDIRALIESSTNDFFGIDAEGHLSNSPRAGPWSALPQAWRASIEELEQRHQCHTNSGPPLADWREIFLKGLAMGRIQSDVDNGLRDFVVRCRQLPVPRGCSDEAVFSRTIRPRPFCTKEGSSPAPPAIISTKWPFRATEVSAVDINALGMSQKKLHEVTRFTQLASAISSTPAGDATPLATRPIRRVIDVGSGQGHLSRTLTGPPWSLDVLAVDASGSQTSGGEKLNLLAHRHGPLSASCRAPQGTLTQATRSLDSASIRDLLLVHQTEGPVLLVGLHACGDLTPSLLDAFASHESQSSTTAPPKNAMIAVGCCYNLLSSPPNPHLPFSRHLPPSLAESLGKDWRQVATQSPAFWTSTAEEWRRARNNFVKLAFRGRWEVERKACIAQGILDPTKRLGRLGPGYYESYPLYRRMVFAKLGISNVGPPPPLAITAPGEEGDEQHQAWQNLLFRVGVAWTLRALLGPCVESLILLDRYLGLCDRLQSIADGKAVAESNAQVGWSVEWINLFDQTTGSLRNVALVVRPLASHVTPEEPAPHHKFQ